MSDSDKSEYGTYIEFAKTVISPTFRRAAKAASKKKKPNMDTVTDDEEDVEDVDDPPEEVVASSKKAKLKRAPRAKGEKAKHTPSAYIEFCKSERPKIVDKMPDLSFGDVGKQLGVRWQEYKASRAG